MKFLDKKDKRIKRILIIAVIFLGVIPFIIVQLQVISHNTNLEYPLPAQKLDINSIQVNQIYIEANFSATALLYPWCSGNGTITNPYIVENLTVDKYIFIKNTTDYFIIRNCTINSFRNHTGITLEMVRNGRIFNNTLCNNTRGISVDGSCNIIMNNTIYNNGDYGIYLDSNSREITIINNTICDNKADGILLFSNSRGITIINNTICDNTDDGIYLLSNSRGITIINNTIYKNGNNGIVYSKNNLDSVCMGNIIRDNRMYGIILVGGDACQNNTIMNNTICNNRINGIYLKDVRNITIEDNNIYDNHYAILIFNSTKTLIKNNSIHNNMEGIYLNPNILSPLIEGLNATPGSTYNTITENIIYNNRYNGIFLCASDRNVVKNNILRNNSRGIYLDNYSNANLLYLNYFFETNAFDLGSYNHWDNGSIGNYWSDYTGVDANNDGIGDTPYIGSVFQDNYPIYISSPPEEGIPGFQLIHIITILALGLVLIRFKFRYYLKEYKRK